MFSQFKTPCLHRQSSVIRHPPTPNLLFKHSRPWYFILGCTSETKVKANFCSRTLQYHWFNVYIKTKKRNLWNLPEEFFQWGKWKLRHLGCLGWTQNVHPETKGKKKNADRNYNYFGCNSSSSEGMVITKLETRFKKECFVLFFFFLFFFSNFWSSDTDQRGR